MKEQLISFETAKLAKEKGLDLDTIVYAYINYYSDSYTGKRDYVLTVYSRGVYYGENPIYLAPTQSLLQKWLRDEHNIHIDIHAAKYAWNNKNSYLRSVYKVHNKHTRNEYVSYRVKEVETYEEALEVGLQEALKHILKDK